MVPDTEPTDSPSQGGWRILALVALVALAVPTIAGVTWVVHRLQASSPVATTGSPPPSPTPIAVVRTPAPDTGLRLTQPTTAADFSPSPVTTTQNLIWYSLPGDDLTAADETRLRALDWSGHPSGAMHFVRTGTRPDDIPIPSPDGRLFLLRGAVIGTDGREVEPLATELSASVIWANDSNSLCRLGFFPTDAKGRIGVGVASVSNPRWSILTTLPLGPDGANPWSITACNRSSDVIVLSRDASKNKFPVQRMEVRSMRDGHLLSSVDYDSSPSPCPTCRAADIVMASLDASTLVECRRGAGCSVRRLPEIEIHHIDDGLGTLVGISAQGRRIVFEQGIVDTISGDVIMRPPTGQRIQYTLAHPGFDDVYAFLGPSVSGPAVRHIQLIYGSGGQNSEGLNTPGSIVSVL